ncbi:MAG TPA: hypothetical protein VIM88_07195 [Sulfurovum sp.]|uniref:hypothetical protein n=1 Tax=Sulfurovum sp. TaxID=1969726 RepID=UPI002F927073
MKHIVKISLLLAAFLAMQGCATHQKFVQKYDSWVGKDINHLIQQIGYPDSTYTLPNQNKVYVYARSRIYSYPSMSMGYGHWPYYHGPYGTFGYGTDVVQKTCKLFLETNQKGIIVKWGSSGNACVSE